MKRLIFMLTTLLAVFASAMAQHTNEVYYSDPYAGFNEETFMDMDFEPNLLTPVVPDKEKAAVRRHMREAARKLKGRFTVELIRDDEVMVASFLSGSLFLPNDTLLTDDAENVLKPAFALMKDPLKYKVVAAMHTDDTTTYRSKRNGGEHEEGFAQILNRSVEQQQNDDERYRNHDYQELLIRLYIPLSLN